jgi:bifunctional NMN adenylyltransferase/nudix hydrolase
VLVLGSAGSAPSPRNPFSATEREWMIRASLDPDRNSRLVVTGQRDVWDVERWAEEVRRAVAQVAPGTTALVGHHKDATSSYLDNFPEWTLVEVERKGPLDATPLREQLLSSLSSDEVLSKLRGSVPAGTMEWLEDWAKGSRRQDLTQESIAIREYRDRWGTGPFLAVDAVVRCMGRVLLVRRGKRPGKGLWALPGGFLEPDEQPESGARRELAKETRLNLDGFAPTDSDVFAHPGRSLRGRIVAHVFLYEPDWAELPEVTGADGAVEACWTPLADLAGMESRLFEDHFHILDRMLGGILTA